MNPRWQNASTGTDALSAIDSPAVLTAADRSALITDNVRLVPWAVSRFYPALRGHDRIEAVAAGNLGLVIAAQRFDPDRGASFATHATWFIRSAITQARRKDRRRGFRHVDPDLMHLISFAAMESPEDIIAAREGPDPDAAAEVEDLIALASPREREYLVAHFWRDESLEAIAERDGISRTRAGQVIARGLKRIRAAAGVPA
jgi:RNA polymerase sigma factor (sigma-70 family)